MTDVSEGQRGPAALVDQTEHSTAEAQEDEDILAGIDPNLLKAIERKMESKWNSIADRNNADLQRKVDRLLKEKETEQLERMTTEEKLRYYKERAEAGPAVEELNESLRVQAEEIITAVSEVTGKSYEEVLKETGSATAQSWGKFFATAMRLAKDGGATRSELAEIKDMAEPDEEKPRAKPLPQAASGATGSRSGAGSSLNKYRTKQELRNAHAAGKLDGVPAYEIRAKLAELP